MKNAAREEIVKALFDQYLSHYENPGAEDRYRLDDYEIENIDTSKKWQEYQRDNNEFAATVTFSVKPSVFEYSHWNAGNGETGANGWIKHKSDLIRVLTEDGSYQLEKTEGG